MPKIGEAKSAKELGYNTTHRFIWWACIDCGKERWVQLDREDKPRSQRCLICGCKSRAGQHRANPNGKIGSGGYLVVKLYPDNLFYLMAHRGGYVYLHRLVMAKHLGRCLKRAEIVHHKNHIRTDNRVENLELFSDNTHMQITYLEERIKVLENKLAELEKV